jgi:CBS domain-containing protein
MKVQDVMTRGVRSCRPTDALAVAVRIMRDERCGFVPVTDEKGEIAGVITDRDVCLKALAFDRSLHAIRVAEAMTREVHTADPQESIEDAEHAMRLWQVRRLPVVDRLRRLVGVLSLDDLAARARDLDAEGRGVARTLGGIARPARSIDA